jgi:hypothetical protein
MPIAKPETSVFISYGSADRPIASRLAGDLRRRGVKTWIDQTGIGPGQRWLEKIEEAVAQSDFLIAVLSRSSVGSKWVSREIRLALAQGVQERRAKLIPVAYQRCTLPRALSELQVVDLSTPAAYRKVLSACLRASQRPGRSRGT